MRPEAKVQAAIVRYLKTIPDLWFTKLHGGPMQKAGLPDLCLVLRGFSIWLEVKSEDGKVTPLQEATMSRIRAAGGTAEVVRSVDDVRRILANKET